MGFDGKPLAKSYPAMQLAYSTRNFTPLNVGGTAITYAGPTNVPGAEVSFDDRQLPWDFATVENYAPGASFVPRLLFEGGATNGVCIRPVFLGTASDSGANDPRGKIAVMSVVQVHELTQFRPDPNETGRTLQRNLLAQFVMTAETGVSASLLAPTSASKLLSAAHLATYTQRVMCADIQTVGGVLLPTGLTRVGAHSWAFDTGGAPAIEFHVSCVNAATGTPTASVPAFALFAQAIEL